MKTDYNTCIICRGPASDEHHLIFGSNRMQADADALLLPVCRACHSAIHNERGGAGTKSKQIGQLIFELRQAVLYGSGPDEARARFRQRYGKSFI